MSYRIVLFLFLFINLFCALGNSQEKRVYIPQHPIPTRFLSPPMNFSDYLGNFFQGKYGEENLRHWVTVHNRLLADFAKWETLDSEERMKLENAYISQWALLLAGSETMADDGTRRKIYEMFKETLLQNGRHQASMLYVFHSRISTPYSIYRNESIIRPAFAESTVRPAFAEFYDYIKEDLWKLLERTKNAAVISNICVIAMALDENNPAENNWSKIASKQAALAKQPITSETAMALIEIHFAENARNVRAEMKRNPAPQTQAETMPRQQPLDAFCPTIGRLIDMEWKMQVEDGKRPLYKILIRKMVERNSPEIRW